MLSRGDQIALISLFVAVITVATSLFVPEIRCNFLRLKLDCPEAATLPSNSDRSPNSESPVGTSPVPSPTTPLPPVAPEPLIIPLQWTHTALNLNLNGRLGQDFTYKCPSGGSIGRLWGTDIYTTDSSICTAAVHAGLITAKNGGQVTIRIDPGQDAYIGTTRNGVSSSDFGSYGSSFSFLK
jgi:hypothetical protein